MRLIEECSTDQAAFQYSISIQMGLQHRGQLGKFSNRLATTQCDGNCDIHQRHDHTLKPSLPHLFDEFFNILEQKIRLL